MDTQALQVYVLACLLSIRLAFHFLFAVWQATTAYLLVGAIGEQHSITVLVFRLCSIHLTIHSVPGLLICSFHLFYIYIVSKYCFSLLLSRYPFS